MRRVRETGHVVVRREMQAISLAAELVRRREPSSGGCSRSRRALTLRQSFVACFDSCGTNISTVVDLMFDRNQVVAIPNRHHVDGPFCRSERHLRTVSWLIAKTGGASTRSPFVS